jgi:hypothetical protein
MLVKRKLLFLLMACISRNGVPSPAGFRHGTAVYLPFSTDLPAIDDVTDSAICLALAAWSNPLSDQPRASVMAAARLDLQTIAQHLAQDAAQFS